MSTRFYVKTLIAVLALSLLLILPACNGAKKITGEAADNVIAYTDPMADNVVQGLETGDYATFSQNFTDDMKKALPQSSFESMAQTFQSKLGAYQSREVSSVEELQGNIAVIYTLTYSQAKAVTMRLVTTPTEPHQVGGLWFNAPELR